MTEQVATTPRKLKSAELHGQPYSPAVGKAPKNNVESNIAGYRYYPS